MFSDLPPFGFSLKEQIPSFPPFNLNLIPCFAQVHWNLLEPLRDLFADISTTNHIQEFSHSNLRTKATPNAAQFQANEDHLSQNFLQLQCASRADDLLLVNLYGSAWERCDFRAGSYQDVSGLDLARRPVGLIERRVFERKLLWCN
jgi:hypothetical protein